MKQYILICSMLLVFAFITSCNGQNETDPAKDSISQPNMAPWLPEILQPENDPYFTESTTISTSYGPRSIVRNIIQDRNGNFWFASWEGIIRYVPSAGETGFTNYTNKLDLRRFRVFSILEDKRGNIWFGTIGAGVYRYEPSADKAGGKPFTNFTTNDGLVNDKVTCIMEDKRGNIWFGTTGGVSCYDPSADTSGGKLFRNFTTEEGLINNDINSIVEDKNGRFWFGTRGEAFYSDPHPEEGIGKAFTILKNKDGSSFNNVRCIIEDKKGNIWLGGNDGLWRYNESQNISFTNFAKNFVGYIYEDRKGNLWTSSEGPNPHTWVFSRYDASQDLQPDRIDLSKSLQDNKPKGSQILIKEDMFFGIIEDKEGGIWFGSLNGVCRYDPHLSDGAGLEKSFNYFRD